jgi:serine/threonine protein kinase
MRNESEESELESGEVIACRYRVAAHYRTHPLGELYCCYDQSTGTDSNVLLQRLRREFALPGVQDRLFETRGSATLESPVIADILDYGEDIDGRPFLVTPWSDDASLDAVERPLGFAEAVAIVVRVAEALAPLHAQGMLHGGVEPASVLVDEQREVTGLLGFGLAPALAGGADRTRALPLLVSPGYAAPELITGQPLGPQTDVYALGILLWELIFAQLPFRGATLRVLDAHLNQPLPDFELPFDAPASFESTLRRMLAKRPEDRFADAGAVVGQLRGHLLEPMTFEPASSETGVLASLVCEPTAKIEFLDILDMAELEDEEQETVVFKAVREWDDVPLRMPCRAPASEPVYSAPVAPVAHAAHSAPESHRAHGTRGPSHVLPKLAVALAMCVSVMLLSLGAI